MFKGIRRKLCSPYPLNQSTATIHGYQLALLQLTHHALCPTSNQQHALSFSERLGTDNGRHTSPYHPHSIGCATLLAIAVSNYSVRHMAAS